MKKNNIFKKYPEVLAYIEFVGGKLVFDFDDTKVPIEQIMVALHQITGEYITVIANNSMALQNQPEMLPQDKKNKRK